MGKIIISTEYVDITGKTMQSLLREDYKIELEMSAPNYAIAITSPCDSGEAFERLSEALFRIDGSIKSVDKKDSISYSLPERVMSPFAAVKMRGTVRPLREAKGTVSLEYVWAYPPGIPILAPGEIIDKEIIRKIDELAESEIFPRSDFGMLPEIMCTNI